MSVDPRRPSRRVRVGRGLSSVAGYGLSMVLLAIGSLIAIPAMVTASGPGAWGMIAAGQSIGGVGSVIVGWGWGLSGPAAIARADQQGRLGAYLESVRVKFALFVPVAVVTGALAFLIGREYGAFAAAGAVSQASIGLLANWYFVGVGRPYAMLALETIPRVGGTLVGIGFMLAGSSALVGVLWQLVGPLAAVAISSVWILRPWRWSELRAARVRPMSAVLVDQRRGIASTLLSSVYISTPVVIVALVAPAVQPVYAVVDKVQRQIVVALGPVATFLQGWVPRAEDEELIARARTALRGGALAAVLLGAAMFAVEPFLIRVLGGGQIHPSVLVLGLMALLIALGFLESIVSKACLAGIDRLDAVARGTLVGTVVGLPLVAIGALVLGVPGALTGIILGFIVRLAIEVHGIRRAGDRAPRARRSRRIAGVGDPT